MAGSKGKTGRLLNRLPHFYSPKELGKTFLSLYETFGANLEKCELDIFEVLRSHHVQTAENVGSEGYIAPPSKHGDLDKLFSLYLEALGGTSQLVTMNPLFTRKSFDIEKILGTLYKTDISKYLVKILLCALEEKDTIKYLKIKKLLNDTYGSDEAIYILTRVLLVIQDVSFESRESDNLCVIYSNDPIARYLTSSLRFKKEEINGSFVFSLLIQDSQLTQYLAGLLNEQTKELLYSYDGKGNVSDQLADALVEELNNKLLKDPFLFQRNYEYFRQIDLDRKAVALRNSLNKEFLKREFTKQFENDPGVFDHNKANLHAAFAALDFAELPARTLMNDIQRFNRMLLDHAGKYQSVPGKAWNFKKRIIPAIKEVRTLLQGRLNALLQSEDTSVTDLFTDLLSASLNGEDLIKQYEEDQLMLRRFLLESIFPYEITHIYRAYQERLQALIKVLRKGASTKQGIKDIVAANFGIIGNDPDMQRVKNLIRIKEYDPEETMFADVAVPLLHHISIFNENQNPAIPKIKVTMLDSTIRGIRNIEIIDNYGKKSFTVPLEMNAGDSFLIEDGKIIFNGVQSSWTISGDMLTLPSRKKVRWMINAEIWSNNIEQFGTYGHFDSTTFGDGIFINESEPVVHVEVLSYKLTYAAFSINIPWHIEGVTDRFAETIDHPRHKIRGLVSKVKAAGIRATVTYFQDFYEVHEYADYLDLGMSSPIEMEGLEDTFSIEGQQGIEEQHRMDDQISFTGLFGYTEFGSHIAFGQQSAMFSYNEFGKGKFGQLSGMFGYNKFGQELKLEK